MKKRIRGWNSWDAYGMYLDEEAALEEAGVLARELAPSGYDVFTVDMGWEGTKCPLSRHAKSTGGPEIPLEIDEYGRYRPSPALWPAGFDPLSDRLTALGLTFGLHVMRGVPRAAVERRLPIADSEWRCDEIADRDRCCAWNNWNFGLKPDHPGSAEYLRSVFRLLRDWGVGYLKLDDITEHPEEIRLVRRVLDEVWPECVLSLSPGNDIHPNHTEAYNLADAVRVTGDVWDRPHDLEQTLTAVERVLDWGLDCAVDLDMLPLGRLRIATPEPETGSAEEPFEGWARECQLSQNQQAQVIALRAMVGSPLLMGGSLRFFTEQTRKLLTDPVTLACHDFSRNPQIMESTSSCLILHADNERGPGHWRGEFHRAGDSYSFSLYPPPETSKTAP